MKTPSFLLALIVGLIYILAGPAMAQAFTALYSFTGGNDGAYPIAGLVLSGNALYGTTTYGGSSGSGTVFKINTDGAGFTNLYSFGGSGLMLSGSAMYGTAGHGGSFGNGTVFKVNTDGTGFTNLHSFTANSLSSPYTNSDGGDPKCNLILSGNTLYGTAQDGGGLGRGTVFRVNTDGTGFTNLYNFTGGNDGPIPSGGLTLSGNTLFGSASKGGSTGGGTLFKVSTDGSGFTNIYAFTGSQDEPNGGLILSGNILYGTTSGGGSSGSGTVFKVNTNGTSFTNLYIFTGGSDGLGPSAGLILSGNTLYGTAFFGGSFVASGLGGGTLFKVNTNGTGFTVLYNFSGGSDGAYPSAGLILSGNILYGTAQEGGGSGRGTVFSLSFAPQLTIIHSGTNVILTWPTNVAGFNYAGFNLQCSTNLVSTVVWSNVSTMPVIANGQNTVTNSIFGTRMFYRLAQQ